MAKVKVKLNWNAAKFKRLAASEQRKALTRAAIFLAREMKENLSVGVKYAQTKNAKGQFTKKKIVERSAPGEFPRLDTGELRRSITWEISGSVARVGTNKIYGKYLELGTRHMEARPFLRPTLMQNSRKVADLLTRSMDLR